MTLSEYRIDIEKKLTLAGFDQPSLEAKWLLESAINKSLILNKNYTPSEEEQVKIEEWVQRRLKGEPLSRIRGMREFWSLPFHINPYTLDPRPETELIVEGVLEQVSKNFEGTILDLGTGSGCILIALLHELKFAKGIGIDQSLEALDVAKENAELNHVKERAIFLQGNWGENLVAPFDIIVSNPPYIPLSDKETLDKGVRAFDPPESLFAGIEGLDDYKVLAKDLKRLLSATGVAFLEIGMGQGDAVQRIMLDHGLKISNIFKDLAGIERVVCVTQV